ncbi:GNAT family N-acetyltransferase [Mucilaginibacter roseus]|uniref:GNAT family N-acetyltransferase n=1 Tax=Mucilaginibacter roseus TaxID=1528868 RepID=A0ABS8TY80_9SPHI|nr:GNAT family N-acetyltransferase [Mucilaginibacter roseus]MCD8739819.1 GNAT family N-acetyltransferase [Mucilaginibacter roseus]
MSTIMNDAFFVNKGYLISTDKTLIDINSVYNYLNEESYWAKGMPFEKLKTAIQNSMCFGVYLNNRQAGFARVVTDNATFAYLCDVFILPHHRGIGLSKWLVQSILNHPELQGLRRWALATADAHGLYEQFGFSVLSNPERWMGIYKPYAIVNKNEEVK